MFSGEYAAGKSVSSSGAHGAWVRPGQAVHVHDPLIGMDCDACTSGVPCILPGMCNELTQSPTRSEAADVRCCDSCGVVGEAALAARNSQAGVTAQHETLLMISHRPPSCLLLLIGCALRVCREGVSVAGWSVSCQVYRSRCCPWAVW